MSEHDQRAEGTRGFWIGMNCGLAHQSERLLNTLARLSMLTVHHLGKSQSERIVWLCEELEIPYELKRYARAPMLAPADYKALHPIGTAPVITDGDLVLAESGPSRVHHRPLRRGPPRAGPPIIPASRIILYWFHFANGTLRPPWAAA